MPWIIAILVLGLVGCSTPRQSGYEADTTPNEDGRTWR